MNEKDLAGLVVDRMLLPKGWTRDPVGAGVTGTVMLRDDAGSIYHWPDPREFLLGWGGGGISPVFDVGSLDCPEMEKFRSGFSSIEELRLALEVAGLLQPGEGASCQRP